MDKRLYIFQLNIWKIFQMNKPVLNPFPISTSECYSNPRFKLKFCTISENWQSKKQK